jgi:hypothetical protein
MALGAALEATADVAPMLHSIAIGRLAGVCY